MTIPVTILQQKTIADSPGDWSQAVPFNQFDPSAGALLDAVFTMAGTLHATASIENLAPVAATVNLGVAATIVATAPGVQNVASITPAAVASVNLGAFQGTFDGTLDFSGPSGTVVADLTASQMQTSVITLGGTSAGAPLLGSGTFDVTVSSYATSTVEGNGNLAVLLHGGAGAVLSLRYDPALPVATTSNSSAAAGFMSMVNDGLMIWGIWPPVTNFVTTVPQVVTLPSQTSGWTGTAAFTRFDPALGTLNQILLNVGNTVAGTFSAENLESTPAAVFMSENASMTVVTPGETGGETVNAAARDNLGLGAYDGAADFAGASGRSDTIGDVPIAGPPLDATLTRAADLKAFTGTGTIVLPVSTAGTSTVTGPSNLLEEITQQTGGTVSVSYVYTPGVGAIGPADGAALAGLSGAEAFAGAALWAAKTPGLTFIGGLLSRPDGYAMAQPNQTFVIESGAVATIDNFSLTAGDKLSLAGLLAGAPLAPDLSNLGSFLTVIGQTLGADSGTNTTLAVRGPGGAASLTLTNSAPVSVLDLVSNHTLILPPH